MRVKLPAYAYAFTLTTPAAEHERRTAPGSEMEALFRTLTPPTREDEVAGRGRALFRPATPLCAPEQHIPAIVTVVAVEFAAGNCRRRDSYGFRSRLVCERIEAEGRTLDSARHDLDGRVLLPQGWRVPWKSLLCVVVNEGDTTDKARINVFARGVSP